jgi:hypothetical protein
VLCEVQPTLSNVITTDKGVFIYPNPVQNILFLEPGELRIQSVSLVDMEGRVVYHQDIASGNEQPDKLTIDTQNIQNGIYIIKIFGERVHYVARIVVD